MSADLRDVFSATLDDDMLYALGMFAVGVGVRFGFLFLAGLLVTVFVGLPVISFGEFLGGAFSLAFVEAVVAEYVGEVGVTPAVAVMLIAPLPFVLISELFTTILPGYWIWSLEDQYLLWLGVVVLINIYTIFDRERHHPLTIFAAGVGVRFGFLFLAGLLVTVVVGLPVISFGEFLGGAFSLAFVEAVVAEYVEEWSVEVTSVVTVVLIAPLVLVVIGEWFTRPGVVGYWIGNPQDQYLLWLGVVMAVGSYAILDRMEAEMEKAEEKMEKEIEEESKSQQTEKSGRDNINRDDQQRGQRQSNQDLRRKFERLYRERKQQ